MVCKDNSCFSISSSQNTNLAATYVVRGYIVNDPHLSFPTSFRILPLSLITRSPPCFLIHPSIMSGPLVRPKKPSVSPLRRNQPTIKREPGIPGASGIRPPSFATISDPQTALSNVTSLPSNGTASSSSSSSNESFRDYRLKACTLGEVKDRRHHILRFHARAKVNPAQDFTAPIRFHRKDPRNLQFQLTVSEMEQRKKEQEDSAAAAANEKTNEIAKKPAADMSVVAPDGGARRTNQPFQKKLRQVQSGNEASRKLRYEEYYPWVMEDFDGKNTWVGSYEAAQSDTYALFFFDGNGFKMVPAEKFYKMTPRNKYTTLSLEEAEQRMEKKANVPRWIMKHIAEEQQQSGVQVNQRRKFKTVDGSSGAGRRGGGRGLLDDDEEIDYDEEFADDEEAPIMDGNEEDVKEVEEKIKKEQRNATYLGQPEDVADEEEATQEPLIDREGRKLRKYLRSLEKNAFYESDDEENPYVSEKDSDEDMDDVAENDQKQQEQSIAVKQERGVQPVVPAIIRMMKKEYKDLPPGMVILQLPPQMLSRFPKDVWNPSAKRKRNEELDGSLAKKSKIRERSKSKSWSPDPRGGPPKDEDLLTEEDVRSVISAKPITTKELLGILQPKLKKHPQNPERLKALARKVARLHEGVLVLKESTYS